MNYCDHLCTVVYIREGPTHPMVKSGSHFICMLCRRRTGSCCALRQSKMLCWLYWPSFKLENMIRIVHAIDLDEFNSPTRIIWPDKLRLSKKTAFIWIKQTMGYKKYHSTTFWSKWCPINLIIFRVVKCVELYDVFGLDHIFEFGTQLVWLAPPAAFCAPRHSSRPVSNADITINFRT